MNETEWLASENPCVILDHLPTKVTERKLRLFSIACCRRIVDLLSDARFRTALELAENSVDKPGLTRILSPVYHILVEEVIEQEPPELAAVLWAIQVSSRGQYTTTDAAETARLTADALSRVAENAARRKRQNSNLCAMRTETEERRYQCQLLRDIVTTRRSAVRVNPAFRSPLIVSIAMAAYEKRLPTSGTLDSDRLAVLADALEDASCDNAELLGHLRGPGPHVRGCWAVDLLLGKE